MTARTSPALTCPGGPGPGSASSRSGSSATAASTLAPRSSAPAHRRNRNPGPARRRHLGQGRRTRPEPGLLRPGPHRHRRDGQRARPGLRRLHRIRGHRHLPRGGPHPDRTVPRATYIAVGFLGLFYAFISWVIIEAFGNTGAVAAGHQEPGQHVLHRDDHLRRGLGHRPDARADRDQPVRRAARLPQRDHPLHLRAGLRGRAAAPAGPHPPVHKSPYIAGLAQTALAALVVAGFAAFHADPYLQLLLWVNTPGVIGIVILQALTAFAGGLLRRTQHTESAARTLVAPLAAGILLTGAALLIIWRSACSPRPARRQLDPDRLSPRRVRPRRRIRRPDAPPPPRGVRAAGHHRRRRRGPRRRQSVLTRSPAPAEPDTLRSAQDPAGVNVAAYTLLCARRHDRHTPSAPLRRSAGGQSAWMAGTSSGTGCGSAAAARCGRSSAAAAAMAATTRPNAIQKARW